VPALPLLSGVTLTHEGGAVVLLVVLWWCCGAVVVNGIVLDHHSLPACA